MKKFLFLLGIGLVILGGFFFFRGNSGSEESPFSHSMKKLYSGVVAETASPSSDSSETVLGSTENSLPHEDLVFRFTEGKEKRDWRGILHLRRWLSSLPSKQLLPFVAYMEKNGKGILLGQMFELAFKESSDRHLRREISRVVMSSVENLDVIRLSEVQRRETLHLMAVYGGANGAVKLLSLLGNEEDPEVKQAASLALGKEGSLNAIPHLKLMADQVDLDLSGIYAILALEKMGRRSESPFSIEETSSWKRSLVKTIEFDSDFKRVGESLVTLARFHDRGTNEILISLVERETSSMVLRRKALSLLAKEGTEENLEALDSLPYAEELSAEIESARVEIQSRQRGGEK
jgi:hypothetical protein